MNNIENISLFFKNCLTEQDIYSKIIDLGKSMHDIDPQYQIEENRVQGCQSTSYLYSEISDDLVYFFGSSDALISSGLMKIMLIAYSGKSPEYILKEPPTFLEELGILSSISLTRINGLKSLHLLMKKQALNQLVNSK
ncbi:MAG: SufE family protein [Rhabdochlamydiaceae bacterium]|nr:SufE family protein [Candidatus Amphrikana amoebophyrae]